jgi:hypothetical protein
MLRKKNKGQNSFLRIYISMSYIGDVFLKYFFVKSGGTKKESIQS